MSETTFPFDPVLADRVAGRTGTEPRLDPRCPAPRLCAACGRPAPCPSALPCRIDGEPAGTIPAPAEFRITLTSVETGQALGSLPVDEAAREVTQLAGWQRVLDEADFRAAVEDIAVELRSGSAFEADGILFAPVGHPAAPVSHAVDVVFRRWAEEADA